MSDQTDIWQAAMWKDAQIADLRAQLAEQARTIETLTNERDTWKQSERGGIQVCGQLFGQLTEARAQIARLTEESDGRKRVLFEKADELRQEWTRAEQAEAALLAQREMSDEDFETLLHSLGEVLRTIDGARAVVADAVECIKRGYAPGQMPSRDARIAMGDAFMRDSDAQKP